MFKNITEKHHNSHSHGGMCMCTYSTKVDVLIFLILWETAAGIEYSNGHVSEYRRS